MSDNLTRAYEQASDAWEGEADSDYHAERLAREVVQLIQAGDVSEASEALDELVQEFSDVTTVWDEFIDLASDSVREAKKGNKMRRRADILPIQLPLEGTGRYCVCRTVSDNDEGTISMGYNIKILGNYSSTLLAEQHRIQAIEEEAGMSITEMSEEDLDWAAQMVTVLTISELVEDVNDGEYNIVGLLDPPDTYENTVEAKRGKMRRRAGVDLIHEFSQCKAAWDAFLQEHDGYDAAADYDELDALAQDLIAELSEGGDEVETLISEIDQSEAGVRSALGLDPEPEIWVSFIDAVEEYSNTPVGEKLSYKEAKEPAVNYYGIFLRGQSNTANSVGEMLGEVEADSSEEAKAKWLETSESEYTEVYNGQYLEAINFNDFDDEDEEAYEYYLTM